MLGLQGKRILLIAPKFFGYEIQISQALERAGAQVYFHGDKPSESKWAKAFLRLFPRLTWLVADRVYTSWLEKQGAETCDIVFIIKGEAVSPFYLKWLHKRYPRARFVLYMWDSLANVRFTQEKLPFFDRVLSFDPVDCKSHPSIQYRPLFFINNYLEAKSDVPTAKLFFFGTLNGDRPQVLAQVVRAIGGRVAFDYNLYVRSKLELALRRFVDHSLRELASDHLLFKSVPAAEIKRRMSQCSCVLDIEHPQQTGLTMRTFEVLASGKKLITTNQFVRQENFFHPSRICVIDRKNPLISNDFLVSTAEPLGEEFFASNSLDGWLFEILNPLVSDDESKDSRLEK